VYRSYSSRVDSFNSENEDGDVPTMSSTNAVLGDASVRQLREIYPTRSCFGGKNPKSEQNVYDEV
jgi:hypothetical protein